VIAIGINTVREICMRQPHAMDAALLQDLVQYKKHKDKGVVMAARSLLALFRDIDSEMLVKKDRGKVRDQHKKTAYGAQSAARGVQGLDLLQEATDSESGSDSDEASDSDDQDAGEEQEQEEDAEVEDVSGDEEAASDMDAGSQDEGEGESGEESGEESEEESEEEEEVPRPNGAEQELVENMRVAARFKGSKEVGLSVCLSVCLSSCAPARVAQGWRRRAEEGAGLKAQGSCWLHKRLQLSRCRCRAVAVRQLPCACRRRTATALRLQLDTAGLVALG